jgi:hypothetical protein
MLDQHTTYQSSSLSSSVVQWVSSSVRRFVKSTLTCDLALELYMNRNETINYNKNSKVVGVPLGQEIEQIHVDVRPGEEIETETEINIKMKS